MHSCQIWLPSTSIMKEIIKPNCYNIPQCAAKDKFEVTHLKMLKWVLGVHKKCNNNFCYGDTGRLPWGISVIPQCLRYFDRVSQATDGHNSATTIIHHAYREQKQLNLPWYQTWSTISAQQQQHNTIMNSSSAPAMGLGFHSDLFIRQWTDSLKRQNKMSFYLQVKQECFGEEPYLQIKNRNYRTQIAKIRSSSHDLMIERGRYGKSQFVDAPKACRLCCNTSDGSLEIFECLPFHEKPIIESEEHVLTECPFYHPLRVKLSDNLKSLLMLKAYGPIMSSHHMREFGKFLLDCYYLRTPR